MDIFDYLAVIFAIKRRFSCDEHVHDDSHAPYVTFVIVLRAEYLGRYIVGCPYDFIYALILTKFYKRIEFIKLNIYAFLRLQQHIFRFDISMNNIPTMQVLDSIQYLFDYGNNFFLWELFPTFLIIDDLIIKFTAFAQLTYQVKSVFFFVDI